MATRSCRRGVVTFAVVHAWRMGRVTMTFGRTIASDLIARCIRRLSRIFSLFCYVCSCLFCYGCRLSIADGGKGPPETSTSTGL